MVTMAIMNTLDGLIVAPGVIARKWKQLDKFENFVTQKNIWEILLPPSTFFGTYFFHVHTNFKNTHQLLLLLLLLLLDQYGPRRSIPHAS